MDRKLLIELFQDGMEYPPGKHRFWISRCFEITVGSDKTVQLDEYEKFSAGRKPAPSRRARRQKRIGGEEMFHVGRSTLDLRSGRVVEESGAGWEEEPPKKGA